MARRSTASVSRQDLVCGSHNGIHRETEIRHEIRGRRRLAKTGHADDAPIEQKLCKKEACAIQWCLAKRNHKEEYCKDFIAAWKACCDRAKASETPD